MGDNYLQRLPESLSKPGEHQRGEIELLAPDESGDFGIKYEDPYVILVRDRVRFPGGKEGGYIRLINRGELAGSPGAVMVPLWAGSVVFIRIFRHATRCWEWELPRGFHEAGLTEVENARKEIQEELGVDVSSAHKIGVLNSNTGLLTGLIGVYAVELAADPSTGGRPQAAESIQSIRLVPQAELHAFIAREGVRCGISLAALMLYLNAHATR